MPVRYPTDDPPPARPGKTTPAAAPAAKKAAPRPRRRAAVIAVGSVLGTAIAGASAAALITPERVDQFFGMFGGAPDPVDYKTVTDADRSVSLEVPSDWIVVDAPYDVDAGGVREPGAALLAGDGVGDGTDWGESAVYIGASTVTASRYALPELTPAERMAILGTLADEADWSIDDCLHANDALTLPTGFTGVSTSWDDCAQTDGMRLWEIYASSDDGAVLLFLQIYLPPGVDASLARHMVETLTVTRSEIPSADGAGSVSP